MWVNAHDFQGNILHLNLALARSITRTAVDAADGIAAKTVIVFDETDQHTVHETPEELMTAAMEAWRRNPQA
jgi:hypothetical protein